MKNCILKFITGIATLIYFISLLALDSEVYFFQIIIANIISGSWLALFMYVNRYTLWKEYNSDIYFLN